MNSPTRPTPTAADELAHHYTHVLSTIAAIRCAMPKRRTKENAKVLDAVDNNIVNICALIDQLVCGELRRAP